MLQREGLLEMLCDPVLQHFWRDVPQVAGRYGEEGVVQYGVGF